MNQNKLSLRPQDLENAKDLSCEKCGGITFTQVFLIKQISRLLSPTGEEINIPLQTFACNSCGHVNKDFLPNNPS
jgi:uncharacterized Zn finger protein